MIMQIERGGRKGTLSVLRGKGIANRNKESSHVCFPVELNWASGSLDELVRKQ